jgi:hypothetical protein
MSPSGSRPLKTAHLLRWAALALVAAYPQYASLGLAHPALHLDRFERPGGEAVFQQLAGVVSANRPVRLVSLVATFRFPALLDLVCWPLMADRLLLFSLL